MALSDLGYQFFGNRFCDVVYGVGKWEGDAWSGLIPANFLKFIRREIFVFRFSLLLTLKDWFGLYAMN